MMRGMILVLAASAVVGASVILGGSAAVAQTGAFDAIPIFGDAADGTTFEGELTVQRFSGTKDGPLLAHGEVTGTFTDSEGNITRSAAGIPVAFPVTDGEGSCPVLSLTLGPVLTDVAGTTVSFLSSDVIVQGTDKSTRNLVCQIIKMFEQDASPDQLAKKLNRLLALL